MADLQPFAPRALETQKIIVGATPVPVIVASRASQVWFDNRSSTDDLLVEFDATADENRSFRIPPNSAQPLTKPDSAVISLARPTGAAAAPVFVTPGVGF